MNTYRKSRHFSALLSIILAALSFFAGAANVEFREVKVGWSRFALKPGVPG